MGFLALCVFHCVGVLIIQNECTMKITIEYKIFCNIDTSFFSSILKVLWLVKFYCVIDFQILKVSGWYFICCVVTSEMVLCLGIYVLLTMMKEQSHSSYLQCFIVSIIIVQCCIMQYIRVAQ